MPDTVQPYGTRPPGLPEDIRRDPAWESARRGVLSKAVCFGSHLNSDFRKLLTVTGPMVVLSLSRLMWRLRLVHSRPGLSEERVGVASKSSWQECPDLTTSKPLWSTRYDCGAPHQITHVCDGCLCAFDGHWYLSAFNLETGALCWLRWLRSPGNWCSMAVGSYRTAAPREGYLALLDPWREVKLWDRVIGGIYHQLPPIGWVLDCTLLAAASKNQGLKVYEAHKHYTALQGVVPQPMEAMPA